MEKFNATTHDTTPNGGNRADLSRILSVLKGGTDADVDNGKDNVNGKGEYAGDNTDGYDGERNGSSDDGNTGTEIKGEASPLTPPTASNLSKGGNAESAKRVEAFLLRHERAVQSTRKGK